MLITTRDKHYYDEDDLEVGNAIPCNVVVNHTIVLTDEEKAEARQQAFAQYQAEELRKLQDRKRSKPKNEASTEETCTSILKVHIISGKVCIS